MPSLDEALYKLLIDLFTESELRIFVRYGARGAEIAASLRSPASVSELAHDVATSVQRHGVLADFMQRLRETFPQRLADIAALAGPWSEAADDRSRRQTAYRLRMNERASRLPRGFGRGDLLTVADVYVEPPLLVVEEGRMAGSSMIVGSLEQALERAHRYWSIVGEPGSGKSLLLQRTTLRLLDDPRRTPLLLRVAELSRLGGFWPAVAAAVGPAGMLFAREEIAARRLVLMLDGYDELEAEIAKTWVLNAADEAAGNIIVVAGREVAFRDQPLGAAFIGLRLTPFSRQHARDLLERRCRPERAEALLHQLEHDGLVEFMNSPLLLTLVALTSERTSAAASKFDRLNLYEYALRLFTEPHRHKQLDPGAAQLLPDPAQARRLLAIIALALHGEDSEQVPLVRVQQRVREWKCGLSDEDVEQFVARMQAVTELLHMSDDIESLLGDVKISFPHRTFREYCCALAIESHVLTEGAASPAMSGLIERACSQPQLWSEVMAMACGLLSRSAPDQADALLRAIARFGPDLALRALAYAESIAEQTMFAVLQQTLGYDRRRSLWEERVKIFRNLRVLVPDPHAVVRLCRKLRQTTRTRHGVDLFWIRQTLQTIADAPLDERIRAEARQGVTEVYAHIPAEARAAVEARMAWREIPAGTFLMGSGADDPERYSDEEPRQEVRIRQRLLIQATPITNWMYEQFDPEHRDDRDTFSGESSECAPEEQDELPVYNICWYEAMAFAAWLDARLPTEAEWEYACRAGSTTRYWCGDEAVSVAEVGWVRTNSQGRPHAVGQPPSPRGYEHPWGLLDMHGNVFEWCLDDWSSSYGPAGGARSQDIANAAEVYGVMRGGSWMCSLRHVRCANRASSPRYARLNDQGIRLVRDAES